MSDIVPSPSGKPGRYGQNADKKQEADYECIGRKADAEKQGTYTVEDIAAILGIGKSSAYKLANSGEFQTIRIGNMIRISRKSFEDWLGMEENEE